MAYLIELFERPFMLMLLLPLLLAGLKFYFTKFNSINDIAVSSLPANKTITTWRTQLANLPEWLMLTAAMLLIIGASGPRKLLSNSIEEGKGIDIMMSMDVSNSMLTKDFEPDRMEVSKQLAKDFITRRTADRIGLVVFGGASFTQSPLTIDHEILTDMIAQLYAGMLGDGTSIGMGLATAVNRLKSSKATSRIVILLTDGANNSGTISPGEAASLARKMGIKVYCIGVGSTEIALSPVQKSMDGELIFGYRPSDLDEVTLRSIAEKTGGMYFRARNTAELEQVYAQINHLEKSSYDAAVNRRYLSVYHIPVFAGLTLFLFSMIIKIFILKRWP